MAIEKIKIVCIGSSDMDFAMTCKGLMESVKAMLTWRDNEADIKLLTKTIYDNGLGQYQLYQNTEEWTHKGESWADHLTRTDAWLRYVLWIKFNDEAVEEIRKGDRLPDTYFMYDVERGFVQQFMGY